MSTLTEIEAAVEALPVAQQKKLFAVLKERFTPAPRTKITGGKLKSASLPGIKGLDPKLSTTRMGLKSASIPPLPGTGPDMSKNTRERAGEIIAQRHAANR